MYQLVVYMVISIPRETVYEPIVRFRPNNVNDKINRINITIFVNLRLSLVSNEYMDHNNMV